MKFRILIALALIILALPPPTSFAVKNTPDITSYDDYTYTYFYIGEDKMYGDDKASLHREYAEPLANLLDAHVVTLFVNHRDWSIEAAVQNTIDFFPEEIAERTIWFGYDAYKKEYKCFDGPFKFGPDTPITAFFHGYNEEKSISDYMKEWSRATNSRPYAVLTAGMNQYFNQQIAEETPKPSTSSIASSENQLHITEFDGFTYAWVGTDPLDETAKTALREKATRLFSFYKAHVVFLAIDDLSADRVSFMGQVREGMSQEAEYRSLWFVFGGNCGFERTFFDQGEAFRKAILLHKNEPTMSGVLDKWYETYKNIGNTFSLGMDEAYRRLSAYFGEEPTQSQAPITNSPTSTPSPSPTILPEDPIVAAAKYEFWTTIAKIVGGIFALVLLLGLYVAIKLWIRKRKQATDMKLLENAAKGLGERYQNAIKEAKDAESFAEALIREIRNNFTNEDNN